LSGWGEDRLLKRVVRNSTYLFASNVISAVLSILTANLLGVAVFGVLGIVISFVSNINRLLSFRMGDVIVRYLGEAMAAKDFGRAGAVVKAAGLIEAATSFLAYLVLALLAPLGARYIAGDPALAPIFLLYGLSILGNITTETATGVLQVGNHYRSQALINFGQSVLTAILIVVAYLNHAGLIFVLVAYLVGKMVLGISPIVVAWYWLPRMLGKEWFKASFTNLPPLRELTGFSLSTNFSGTINMVARDSEVLWVGYFFSPLEAGYFKTALAVINLVVMPITPFISTTYPEINTSIAKGLWQRVRQLLNRVTVISFGWTAAVAVGLILFGRPVLFEAWHVFGRTIQVYKGEFQPSFSVLLVLLAGFGMANVLFWNRPLLLSLGRADYPLWVGFWGMAAKVGLAFLIVPKLGYISEAALLSLYFIFTVSLITVRGMKEINRAEQLATAAGAA